MTVKPGQTVRVGDELEWDFELPEPEKPSAKGEGRSWYRRAVLNDLFKEGPSSEGKGQLERKASAFPAMLHHLTERVGNARKALPRVSTLPWIKILVLALASAVLLRKDFRLSLFMEAPRAIAREDPGIRSAFFPPLYVDERQVTDYLRRYAALARPDPGEGGLPAGLHLAMGLLQSRAGMHPLAREANNHFPEAFGSRGFPSGAACWREHRALVEGLLAGKYPPTDAYGPWIDALEKSSYSKDPHFGDRLRALVSRYGLWAYD